MYPMGFFQLSKERNPILCDNMYEHMLHEIGVEVCVCVCGELRHTAP